jgi:threonine aldolase
MLALSKGLGAPFGAVIVGSTATIDAARTDAGALGVLSVHRMGHLAAAAHVALEEFVPRITKDHERARALARSLARIDGIDVDLRSVQTNLVRAEITKPTLDACGFVAGLGRHGIGASVMEEARAVRFATHADISDDDVESAARAAALVLSGAADL